MPPTKSLKSHTTGAAHFDPDDFFKRWGDESKSLLPNGKDLQSSITAAFSLPQNDNYVYHAIASVTLAQVQVAINQGREHGLHAWYPNSTGEPTDVSNRASSLKLRLSCGQNKDLMIG